MGPAIAAQAAAASVKVVVVVVVAVVTTTTTTTTTTAEKALTPPHKVGAWFGPDDPKESCGGGGSHGVYLPTFRPTQRIVELAIRLIPIAFRNA